MCEEAPCLLGPETCPGPDMKTLELKGPCERTGFEVAKLDEEGGPQRKLSVPEAEVSVCPGALPQNLSPREADLSGTVDRKGRPTSLLHPLSLSQGSRGLWDSRHFPLISLSPGDGAPPTDTGRKERKDWGGGLQGAGWVRLGGCGGRAWAISELAPGPWVGPEPTGGQSGQVHRLRSRCR